MSYFLGIDPGITGAIALLNETELIDVQDLPTMPVGQGTGRVKNQINAAAFAVLIRELLAKSSLRVINDYPGPLTEGQPHDNFGNGHVERQTPMVFIEKVGAMPDQGIAGAFSLGDTVGCLRGVVTALGLPIHWVTPQSWKKFYKLPKEKDVARSVAINLYPKAPLNLKKHHNRAEAILIARYGATHDKATGEQPF
jgi:crossover junction endodeoxyribonuclease RuvC